jgi:hypothetical protein
VRVLSLADTIYKAACRMAADTSRQAAYHMHYVCTSNASPSRRHCTPGQMLADSAYLHCIANFVLLHDAASQHMSARMLMLLLLRQGTLVQAAAVRRARTSRPNRKMRFSTTVASRDEACVISAPAAAVAHAASVPDPCHPDLQCSCWFCTWSPTPAAGSAQHSTHNTCICTQAS